MNIENKEQGVILLEAVIAVGVLVTIFTAAIALYIDSVGGIRMTNDQLVATFLAQDGMEQVIAKRQHNYENDLDWLDGITNGTTCSNADPSHANSCGVDYFTNDLNASLPACSTANTCKLYLNTNVFSHAGGGTESYFTRTVKVTETMVNVEAEVIVTVYWVDGPNTLTFPISYNLYNNPNNDPLNP